MENCRKDPFCLKIQTKVGIKWFVVCLICDLNLQSIPSIISKQQLHESNQLGP